MLINGRYKVIRKLGEGGFGHAYLSEDTQMPSKRQCVVKQLKPVAVGAEIYQVVQQRFEREAAMLEKLGEHHTQIPRLYAYFSENQHFYLVQEWIAGKTLDAIVEEQGVLAESQVVSIVTSLLKVLDFVHAHGVIHRDIKPDNVILRAQSQQPVLIDFGAMRETMGTVFNSRNHPTRSIVIGTPGYMSSEQAAGRPIPSSDLYSLGLMAIYMLTGKTPQELPCDPRSGEIVWQNLTPRLSPNLAAAIDQAVRSHPRDRHSSASEMLLALSGAIATTSASALDIPTIAPIPSESPISEAKTVAVVGSAARSAGSVVGSVVESNTSDAQLAQNTVRAQPVSSAAASPARKSFSLWLLGGTAALVGVVAVGAGLAFSHFSSDSTVRSAAVSVESATNIDPATGNRDQSALSVQGEYESARESDTETAPAEESPADLSKRVLDDTAMTLIGQGTEQIDVYEQPSISSASPHYGVPGDRVLSIATLRNSSGDWNLVRFESGAEGWVPSEAVTMDASPIQPPEGSPTYGQLAGAAPDRPIWIFSEPSAKSDTPHYGISGDRVALLDQVQGDNGLTWYQIEFESGAVGWVPADFIRIP